MANTRVQKNRKANSKKAPRVVFRFLSIEHHSMVKRAAKFKGLSLNAWMVQTTLEQARKDLQANSAGNSS
jgi:uncharacterized protein (DUF1778 family)